MSINESLNLNIEVKTVKNGRARKKQLLHMLTATDFVNGLSGIDKMPYKVIFFNNNLWSKIVLHIVIYFCQKI